MAPPEEPLLSARPSSEQSNDQNLAEEDALLTGERTARSNSPPSRWSRWKDIGLFTWALLATAAVIILAVVYQKQAAEKGGPGSKPSGKRNLIFMVSDGMGPTSLSMTRSFQQFRSGEAYNSKLTLDWHMIGQSRTRSTSSLVTDSAAGATAFSCGKKSYNGAIAVLDDHSPCGTVLEAAKKAGYMTGLVVTTRITDATPACFAAHVNMRVEEDLIAEQLIGDSHPLGRVVDLMIGGGRCHFLPNTTAGSCRADDTDVVANAKKAGFNYISTRKDFDGLKLGSSVDLPLLGLIADTDVPYEIDREKENDVYPSLDEMARTAMRALSAATKDSDKGFFLMIEGSRIDHAGHANDPVAQVHEVLAYDKAFGSVLDFLDKDDTPGVMVSTSDHETGGLSAARQLTIHYPEYLWYPGVLANATRSAEWLTDAYATHRDHEPDGDMTAYIKKQLKTGLGVEDASDEELKLFVDSPARAAYTFADIISRRAQTGWATHGHSAADVNIYTSDPQAAKPLIGNHENTQVGEFLRDYLNVDVDGITAELKAKGKHFDTMDASGNKVSWMGKLPEKDQRLDGQDHMQHYEGKFGQRRKRHVGCDCDL